MPRLYSMDSSFYSFVSLDALFPNRGRSALIQSSDTSQAKVSENSVQNYDPARLRSTSGSSSKNGDGSLGALCYREIEVAHYPAHL